MAEPTEPVIGATSLDRSRIPNVVPAPAPFQRSEIGVHKTIGGDPIIDTSKDYSLRSKPPETMMEILHSLEKVIDSNKRSELDKMAAEYTQNPDDYRGAGSLLKSIPDYTEREYLAASIARLQALEASSQKGGAIENEVGLEKFNSLKRLAFGKTPVLQPA